MKKGGRFERFRDRFLTPWWSRYIVMPAFAALPGAIAALWYGINKDNQQHYYLKDLGPWVIFGAAVWAGIFSAIKSGLNDVAAFTVTELVRSRDELLRLIGYVRAIVAFKSRRFHEVMQRLPATPDPGTIFLEITHPEWQIKQILQGVYAFFSAGSDIGRERIMVSLMRWNDGGGHLEFIDYFPDADPPRSPATGFRDSHTIAGSAYFGRDLVVCEDVMKDPRFQAFSHREDGSLFSYPIVDDLKGRVVLVVNVFSTRVRRFRRSDKDAINIPMEVFADRLILENRLAELRGCVARS